MPGYLKSCCSQIPKRFVVCGLCSFAMAIMIFQRTIVEETLQLLQIESYSSTNENEGVKGCPYRYVDCSTETSEKPQFLLSGLYWNSVYERAVRQGFSLGNIIFQTPAGLFVDCFGAPKLFGFAMLLSSLISLSSPHLAVAGPLWFMAGYFVQGICQCVLFPCSINMIARWARESERTTFTGIVVAGVYFGCPLGNVPFWILFYHSPDWVASLYTGGVLGLVWCLLWFCLALSLPKNRPNMTDTGQTLVVSTPLHQVSYKLMHVPWKKIALSKPYLSLLAINCASEWTYYLILQETLAPYAKHIQHLSPFLVRISLLVKISAFPTCVAGAVFNDWLINKKVVSRTASRRLFNFVGVVVPVLIVVMVPLTGCDPYWFISLFVIIFFCKGVGEGPLHANSIDLSPQYAGLLMGSVNSIAILASMFSRELIRIVLTQPGDVSQWEVVFSFSAVLVVVLSAPFMFYGSGQEQPWSTQPTRHRQ